MAVRFACRCGKKLKAADEKMGTRILCPSCGNPIKVPERDTIRVPDVAAPAATSISASNTAGDLLKRSATEGRKRAGKEGAVGPAEDEGRDYTELARFVATRIVPSIVGLLIVCVMLYWLAASVMGTKRSLPPLASVQGTVTLDGQPLEGAIVTFHPVDAKPGSKLAASTARTDEAGHYTLYYLSDVPGAVIGKHRVAVDKRDTGNRPLLRPRYILGTDLVRDVKAGSNTIDLDLKSK